MADRHTAHLATVRAMVRNENLDRLDPILLVRPTSNTGCTIVSHSFSIARLGTVQKLRCANLPTSRVVGIRVTVWLPRLNNTIAITTRKAIGWASPKQRTDSCSPDAVWKGVWTSGAGDGVRKNAGVGADALLPVGFAVLLWEERPDQMGG